VPWEYLRAADGPYPFLLNFNIFGPLAILDYAWTRGAEHYRIVEGFLRDAERAAAERTELVDGAGDVFDACTATGRTAVVAGRVDRHAMNVVLGRYGLAGRVDAVLARAKTSEVTSFEALAGRFGARANRTMIVSDESSVLSEARNDGVMPVGVVTRRSRRKPQLAFGDDEFSAVVSNMTSLATAIRACPVITETRR
jgi:phosphoglycolate phosphatase-like HAD superfamily hydrolase